MTDALPICLDVYVHLLVKQREKDGRVSIFLFIFSVCVRLFVWSIDYRREQSAVAAAWANRQTQGERASVSIDHTRTIKQQSTFPVPCLVFLKDAWQLQSRDMNTASLAKLCREYKRASGQSDWRQKRELGFHLSTVLLHVGPHTWSTHLSQHQFIYWLFLF